MSIKRAALWSMSANYANFVIQFATSVIISRFYLVPAEVGLFSVAVAASLLISVLQDFGIGRYLIAQKDNEPEVLNACFSVTWMVSFAIACILAVLSGPIGSFYGDMQLTPIILVIAVAYFFGAASVVPSALLSKDMQFGSLGIIAVTGAFANAITSIALAANGYSAISLAWGMLASAIARGAIAYYLKPSPLHFTLDVARLKPVMSFGSLNSLLSISGAIGVRSTDLIIGRVLSMSAAGLYTRASGLTVQIHTLLLGSVSGIFYPAFARLHNEGRSIAGHYERLVAVYGALVWPAMLVLAAIAYPMMNLLYGPNWSEAAPLLTFLAISELIFVMLPLHTDIPILMGRIRLLLGLNILDTIVSIASLLIFAQFGIVAAAASRILYGIIWYCIYARTMRQLVQFSWKNMIIIYLKSAIVAIAALSPFAAYFILFIPPENASLIAMIPLAPVSAVIWLATLVIIRHPGRDELFEMVEGIIKVALPRFQLPATFRHRN